MDSDARHDWIFFVTIPLTDREVTRAARGERLVFRKLDPTSGQVRDAHIGYMRCEMVLEPSGYDDEGMPRWEADGAS